THQALLDQLELALTNPAAFSVPVLTDDDEAFIRLLDRIADDRDTLLAAASASAMNTAPPADYSVARLSTLGTFAHLPVKAIQLNGADTNYFADTVTNDQPYRLYRASSADSIRSTLTWDRHFGQGLEPALRN